MRIILILAFLIYSISADVVCTQNTLTYLSTFALSRQNDLNETFTNIQPIIKIPDIVYSPRIGKTYTITNFTPTFYYLDSKQMSRFSKLNQLQVSGGSLRVGYKFNWSKKQLGAAINGTAEGIVISDAISFFKQIGLNRDNEPEWNLTIYFNVTFSNNFPVSQVFPYSKTDSDQLFVMMNKAFNQSLSGKQIFQNSLNALYPDYLKDAIKTDSDNIHVNQTVNYSYFDYRGEFKVTYDNLLHFIALESTGLTLAFSQTITDYPDFDCGATVPINPQDPNIFGGHQTYLSNSLFKSTLQYALKNNFFNIRLTQQNWQSRAFQFYVGDLYLAIPSLKSMNAMTPLSGRCNANDDDSFNFSRNSYSQYKVNMNFSCILEGDFGKVADFSILTSNYVQVTLLEKSLQFNLAKITGKPIFNQVANYKIQNLDFAEFVVSQTLKVAIGSMLLGTGYPTSIRLYPNLQIKQDYMFLYDASLKPHLSKQIWTSETVKTS